MKKLDLRKDLKHLYQPSAQQVEIVEVPNLQFAMVDGAMEADVSPAESPDFQEGLQAMYGISYTLKFMSKLRKENPIDYPVMALEGLWWVEDGEFDITRPGNWKWTLMMLQPEHISKDMFQEALTQLRKKRGDLEIFSRLRLEYFHEGLSVQVMHIGPYADEPATIARMRTFAEEHGYQFFNKHHEIYLGDPRKAAPEKLKTVLRHQIREK